MGAFEKGHKVNLTHGMSRTKIYKTWSSMRERCYSKTHKKYADYGARGILVCRRWEKFENFYADMGERPKGLSLDRINNEKGYSPRNCRWATREEQQNNTRCIHILTARGESHSISKWARIRETPRNTIRNRLHRGWSVDEALFGRTKE